LRLTRRMSKTAQFWMVKQEPTAYSWADFVKDGRVAWTGVRSFAARLNLRAMRKGDAVLFYHSVVGKEVVGIAKVAAEAYPDATATEGDWSCVDLTPVCALKRPVTLDEIKASANLRGIKLVKQSRLSVLPLTAAEYAEIVRLSEQPARGA
jgi:predicted RNA-binding protein with PUA-like domain